MRPDGQLDEAQSGAANLDALVYAAERPELFLKDAPMRHTVGPDGPIRMRSDPHWNLPEPEPAPILVPPDGYTLKPGRIVEIEIHGIDVARNMVAA